MSSIMNCWGRRFPSTPTEACTNIKHNMCNGWKVARVVTSTLLGVAGIGLLVGCSTPSEGNSASGTTASTGMDVYKIAGIVYAVASGVDLAVSAVKTLILPCVLGPKKTDSKIIVDKAIQKAILGVMWEYLPKVFASSFWVVYGAVVLQKGEAGRCGADGRAIVGLSVAFYLLDAGLGLLDLCCLDEIEARKSSRQKNQMLPALPEVGEDGQVIVQVEEEITVSCCGKKGKKDKSETSSPESLAMLPPLEEASPGASGDVIQQDPDPMPEPGRSNDLLPGPKEKGKQGLLCCCVKGKGKSKPVNEAVEMVPLEAQSVPEVSEDPQEEVVVQ